VDVRAHTTLGSDAARLLGSAGNTLLAQPLAGSLDVTAVLLESLLAVHHTGAGGLTKLLHHSRGDCAGSGGSISGGGRGSLLNGGGSGRRRGSLLSRGSLLLSRGSLLLSLGEHVTGDAGLLKRELKHGERGTDVGGSSGVQGREVELLLHGQADPTPVHGLHADLNLLAKAHNGLDGVDHTLGKLGDVHKTLHALNTLDLELHESAEGSNGLNHGHVFLALLHGRSLALVLLLSLAAGGNLAATHGLTALIDLNLTRLTRLASLARRPHGEAHPVLLRVNVEDAHLNLLTLGHNFANVLHEPLRELRDVHETVVLGAEVDERTVCLDGGHFARVDVADSNVLELDGDLALSTAPTTLGGSSLSLHLNIGGSANSEVVTGLVGPGSTPCGLAGQRRAAVESGQLLGDGHGSLGLGGHAGRGERHAGDGINLSDSGSGHRYRPFIKCW